MFVQFNMGVFLLWQSICSKISTVGMQCITKDIISGYPFSSKLTAEKNLCTYAVFLNPYFRHLLNIRVFTTDLFILVEKLYAKIDEYHNE